MTGAPYVSYRPTRLLECPYQGLLWGRGRLDEEYSILSSRLHQQTPRYQEEKRNTHSTSRAAKSALHPSMLRPLELHMARNTVAFEFARDDSLIL